MREIIDTLEKTLEFFFFFYKLMHILLRARRIGRIDSKIETRFEKRGGGRGKVV